MEPFTIDKIVFVFMWCLNLDVSAVNTANHPRKSPLGKKTAFVLKYLLFGRWPLDEVSLFLCKGKRNLTDYTGHGWLWQAQSISNNLKKASGGEKAQRYKDMHSCRQSMVCLSRSSRRSSDKNFIDSRPKRYRLLSSSLVKLDREKSSGSLNVLSFLLGAGIKPNPPIKKSAILFFWGKVFPRLVS